MKTIRTAFAIALANVLIASGFAFGKVLIWFILAFLCIAALLWLINHFLTYRITQNVSLQTLLSMIFLSLTTILIVWVAMIQTTSSPPEDEQWLEHPIVRKIFKTMGVTYPPGVDPDTYSFMRSHYLSDLQNYYKTDLNSNEKALIWKRYLSNEATLQQLKKIIDHLKPMTINGTIHTCELVHKSVEPTYEMKHLRLVHYQNGLFSKTINFSVDDAATASFWHIKKELHGVSKEPTVILASSEVTLNEIMKLFREIYENLLKNRALKKTQKKESETQTKSHPSPEYNHGQTDFIAPLPLSLKDVFSLKTKNLTLNIIEDETRITQEVESYISPRHITANNAYVAFSDMSGMAKLYSIAKNRLIALYDLSTQNTVSAMQFFHDKLYMVQGGLHVIEPMTHHITHAPFYLRYADKMKVSSHFIDLLINDEDNDHLVYWLRVDRSSLKPQELYKIKGITIDDCFLLDNELLLYRKGYLVRYNMTKHTVTQKVPSQSGIRVANEAYVVLENMQVLHTRTLKRKGVLPLEAQKWYELYLKNHILYVFGSDEVTKDATIDLNHMKKVLYITPIDNLYTHSERYVVGAVLDKTSDTLMIMDDNLSVVSQKKFPLQES